MSIRPIPKCYRSEDIYNIRVIGLKTIVIGLKTIVIGLKTSAIGLKTNRPTSVCT